MNILDTTLGKINYSFNYKKNKPYIFFIGGLGSTISSWDEQVKYFRDYFSIVTFDNLGSGKSSNVNTPLSMEMYADNCNEILDKLKIKKAHIVGKSMGGMIAQVFCAKYSKKVDKLVLACTCSSRDKVNQEIIDVSKKIVSKIGMKEIWFNAMLLGYSRDYINKNFSKYKKTNFNNSKKEIDGYLNQCKAISKLDNDSYLKKIKAQTLIIYGKNDLIVPPARSCDMAKYISKSQVISFPGGHGFWKENKKLVDPEVLDFLINKS
ncbi:alpha/beta fold hydrolase [bacterium]|nr:alpha/beta fold hydrolase [bacterium]